MSRTRLAATLAAFLFAAAAAVHAYTYTEILDIYRKSGGRLIRDPKLAAAMKLLRDSRVLYLKSADVGELVKRVEEPEILGALQALHEAGLLPPASTSIDTIHVEKDMLTSEPPSKATQPIYRTGRVEKPIPFFEYIDYKGYYILGGMLEPGTPFEVVNRNAMGVALVSFEKRPPAYISMRHVEGLEPPPFNAVQDPALVGEKRQIGPATFYRAVHEYEPGRRASLAILWVPLGRGLTVRPHVTGAWNRVTIGPQTVANISEMARQAGALAAINGTFFIMGKGGGKPLAPIVLDGQLAWSYNEPRVLKMNRAYLAITTDGQAILGETSLPGEEIVARDARGQFLPGGARIRDLIGGFGWLVKDGDERAWERYAGTQFWYTYYSHHTKRPQTVMGVAPDGKALVLIAQEGLPHSTRPMSLPMLAQYLKANFPITNAVFLDGGGSTEMALMGQPVTRQEHNGAYRKNSTALLVVRG